MHSLGTNKRQRTKRQCKFSMNDQSVYFFLNIFSLFGTQITLSPSFCFYLPYSFWWTWWFSNRWKHRIWCDQFEMLMAFVNDVLFDSVFYSKKLSRPSLKKKNKSFSISEHEIHAAQNITYLREKWVLWSHAPLLLSYYFLCHVLQIFQVRKKTP